MVLPRTILTRSVQKNETPIQRCLASFQTRISRHLTETLLRHRTVWTSYRKCLKCWRYSHRVVEHWLLPSTSSQFVFLLLPCQHVTVNEQRHRRMGEKWIFDFFLSSVIGRVNKQREASCSFFNEPCATIMHKRRGEKRLHDCSSLKFSHSWIDRNTLLCFSRFLPYGR